MSSQAPLVSNKAGSAASKSSAPPSTSQINTSAPSQAAQFFSNDSTSRRSGNSVSRAGAAPRNNQTSKPKHKHGKRFQVLDEDAEAEAYSMQNPHGRRGQQSITHLMQFALPPRPNAHQQGHRSHGPRPRPRNNPTWGLGSGYHSVDKARYVHANYRFIVDPRGDYHAQAEDADVHLDWNNVLQVIASSKSQTASCPICLGEPTAPRMAKCGHIFCLSCLIRYMHSEDVANAPPEKKARWKKCPICWDSIYVTETRPVRWYAGQESHAPREGDDVVLRLVKRKPGSTLAMPRESADAIAKGQDIPWHHAAEVMDYVRVMRGSEDYMIEQYDEALTAIETQQKEDELMFGEDDEWTGRAIRMLKEAKEKVKGIGNPSTQPQKPATAFSSERAETASNVAQELSQSKPQAPLSSVKQGPSQTDGAPPLEDGQSSTTTGMSPHDENAIPRTLDEMRQRNTEKPQPSEYLFYQGLLHYYLSPLDIRILKASFGSYTAFPSSILPRVERVSKGHVIDDELRKKMKYLAHLPYGCEVAFLECDWRDVVSAEVLEAFRPMLERRRRRNDEKDAREEKERIRIEKAEERELAALRSRRRPSIPDTDAFFAPALPPTSAAFPATSTSPSWGASSHAHPRPGFTSLASSPSFSMSTSPNAQRIGHSTTVWGTAAVAPTSPDLYATLPSDEAWRQLHHEDDGWLQGWERDLLLEEERILEQQMSGLELAASAEGASDEKLSGPAASAPSQTQAKKGKAKKGKKITLMSTGGARRGA